MCVSVHVWLHTTVSVHVLNTRVHVYECMCVNAHVSVHVCKWEE